MRAIFFIGLIFSMAGCGGSEKNKELATLDDQIIDTIGEARCTLTQDCGALALGAKPCGGPNMYLAFSKVNTDTEKLYQLAQQHHALEAKLNELNGATSDCSIESEPAVACVNNSCMLQ